MAAQIRGCLYDAELRCTPTGGNNIVDLVNRNAPKCFNPGSSHLTLALVRLGPLHPPQKVTIDANEADSLIADLEYQLGDTKTNFMSVTLSYSHSEFSHTRLETVAVGTVKRHNPASVWSLSQPSVSNDLHSIMVLHWGAQRASALRRGRRDASNRNGGGGL